MRDSKAVWYNTIHAVMESGQLCEERVSPPHLGIQGAGEATRAELQRVSRKESARGRKAQGVFSREPAPADMVARAQMCVCCVIRDPS